MTTAPRTRKRATAVIIRDGKILLFRRVKPDHEYYILPGGGVEEGESPEQAFLRETKEELSIDVVKWHELFTIADVHIPPIATRNELMQTYYCFSVDEYSGTPELGGEEKESMTPENQYHIEWIPIRQLGSIVNIYPHEVAEKLSLTHKS